MFLFKCALSFLVFQFVWMCVGLFISVLYVCGCRPNNTHILLHFIDIHCTEDTMFNNTVLNLTV